MSFRILALPVALMMLHSASIASEQVKPAPPAASVAILDNTVKPCSPAPAAPAGKVGLLDDTVRTATGKRAPMARPGGKVALLDNTVRPAVPGATMQIQDSTKCATVPIPKP